MLFQSLKNAHFLPERCAPPVDATLSSYGGPRQFESLTTERYAYPGKRIAFEIGWATAAVKIWNTKA